MSKVKLNALAELVPFPQFPCINFLTYGLPWWNCTDKLSHAWFAESSSGTMIMCDKAVV
jgi:hypothetical protein